jgi:hypothetical protein
MTEKQFITELARFVESPAWALIAPWFKRICAERVLNARTIEAREQAWQAMQSAGELLTAIENEVTANRGAIDGRKSRHESAGAVSTAEHRATKRGDRR